MTVPAEFMRDCTFCADGGPCACEHVRRLNQPPGSNDTSIRVTLQHRIARKADEQLHSVDPALRPVTDAERVACLTRVLGDVALAYEWHDTGDIEPALLLLAAEVLLQLEAIERCRSL